MKINFDFGSLVDKRKESLLTAIYIGSIFIILATVFYVNLSNDLWGGLIKFFTSLTLSVVPSTGISLPAPANPAAHMNLYLAAFQFSIAVGILEIVILILRVGFHSPVTRKAETIENIVFWLGTSYLIVTYLVNMRIPSEWFVFWAGIILIFGLALISRAFVLLAKR
ncbi:MAG: hypothetical protein ACM3UL_03995 [Ignavibacteria bacterium]